MQQPPRGLSLAASGNENAGLNLFVRSGGLVRVDNARRVNANVFCTATYPPGRSRGFFLCIVKGGEMPLPELRRAKLVECVTLPAMS